MSYTKTNWQTGDVISKARLNHAEQGIYDNAEDITELKNDLMYDKSLNDDYTNGYYIVTSGGTGTVIDTTPIANAGLCYQIVSCRKGDKFTLTGRGGTNPRLWCFTDTDYKVKSKSDTSTTATNLELTAPADGYLIVNSYIVDEHRLTHSFVAGLGDLAIDTIVSGGKITHITSPEQINWRYGYYSTAGNYTKSVTAICSVLPLHIASGSVKGATHTYFQYRFIPDDKQSETVYRSYKADQVDFTEPGTLYLGCRPNPTGNIYLRSLLDDLTVDLYLADAIMPAGYWIPGQIPGVVPVTDYIGRHTDTSGFNQNTAWATAMAWWRALPSRATGYVTEDDLGEVYNGNHLYAYDLIPPAAVGTGKKLPWIFIVASVHGHEKSATYGCCYLIDDMLAHSMEDPVLFYLRNYCRLTILPCANPYGWDYDVQSGHPYEDHEHYGSRYNENGVNINRNYDSYNRADFESDESYTTPWQFNYMGTAPFSETETQAIKKALSERDEVTCFVDLHTNGVETKYIYEIAAWLFNNTDDSYAGQLAIAGDVFIDGLRSHLDELYDVNKPMNQLYGTISFNPERPDSMTWGMEMLHIPSMVFEVPCGGIEHGDDFLGPKLRKYTPDLIKCCGEMTGNMLRLVCYYLGQKMPD